jgi:uncharacterized membrane protein YczE
MASKKSRMDSDKKRHWAKRIALYVLGIIVMTFGISMSIRADIGVAPGGTIAFAVFYLTPLTIGQCSALFHIFCILVQLAITRRPALKLALQFPLALVFGQLLDIFYDLLDIQLPNMALRILFLLAGLIIFSLGIRTIVGANILLAPPDGLAQTAGNVFGWPMSKSKLAFDITATAIAALLTLILAGNAFIAVGVGTVICAIGTGPAIGVYTKLLPFLDTGTKK